MSVAIQTKLVILLLTLGYVVGTTIFVAPDGSGIDNPVCFNSTAPCATIHFALLRAVAGNHSVVLLPGVHTLDLELPQVDFINISSSSMNPNDTLIDCYGHSGFVGASIHIRGVSLLNCTRPEGIGGAVLQTAPGNITIREVTFTACSARKGGAVSIRNPGNHSISIKKSDFINCTAYNAGGLLLEAPEESPRPRVHLEDLAFHRCEARVGAAAARIKNADLVVKNVSILNCTVRDGGFCLAVSPRRHLPTQTLADLHIEACEGTGLEYYGPDGGSLVIDGHSRIVGNRGVHVGGIAYGRGHVYWNTSSVLIADNHVGESGAFPNIESIISCGACPTPLYHCDPYLGCVGPVETFFVAASGGTDGLCISMDSPCASLHYVLVTYGGLGDVRLLPGVHYLSNDLPRVVTKMTRVSSMSGYSEDTVVDCGFHSGFQGLFSLEGLTLKDCKPGLRYELHENVYDSGTPENFSVRLENCRFINNQGAVSLGFPFWSGPSASLVVRNCSFKDCSDVSALQVGWPEADLSDLTFDSCSTPTNGGALAISAPNGTLTSVEVTNCEARGNGGGVVIGRSIGLIATDLVIQGCSAKYNGGGLWVQGGLVLQGNSRIEANEARSGGGVYVDDHSFGPPMSWGPSTIIADNIAVEFFNVRAPDSVDLASCGACWASFGRCDPGVGCDSDTIFYVAPDGGTDGPCTSSTTPCSSIEYVLHTYEGFGRIELLPGVHILSQNLPWVTGSKMVVASTTGNPTDAVIDCNEHSGFYGESLDLYGITMRNCKGTGAYRQRNQVFGGATIQRSHFFDCSSTTWGGAMMIVARTFYVKECAFHRCHASSGGALALFARGVVLEDVSFEGCTAGGAGAIAGDITLEFLSLSRVIIRDCHSLEGSGGGIHVPYRYVRGTLHDVIVTGCSARRQGGGVSNVSINITGNSLISGNHAGEGGGGLWLKKDRDGFLPSWEPSVVIGGNTADDGPDNVGGDVQCGSCVRGSCDSSGDYIDTGNCKCADESIISYSPDEFCDLSCEIESSAFEGMSPVCECFHGQGCVPSEPASPVLALVMMGTVLSISSCAFLWWSRKSFTREDESSVHNDNKFEADMCETAEPETPMMDPDPSPETSNSSDAGIVGCETKINE